MKNRFDLVGEYALPRNADFPFRYTWTFAGEPVPLPGHTLDFKVWRNEHGGSEPLIWLDNASHGGITVPDPTSGQAYYVLPQAALAARAEGFYYYFARDTSPGGIQMLVHGRLQTFGPTT